MSVPAGFASDELWPNDIERAKYTIGWIAPMPVELSPALALLDRITTLHVADDSNIYKAGRIGNHDVVMVVLGKIGLGQIPDVARSMRRSFRHLEHLLLVGLGGGRPDYAFGEQMVLGDVVVGLQVEHLDCGRRTPNGFEFNHQQTYSPTQDLQIAVNILRSIHSLHGTRIPQALQKIREKLRRTIRDNPEDPGPDADHLFDPDYHHKDKAKLCEHCCDPGRSKSRQDRGPKAYRDKDSPLVHYGTIGSGNSLVVGSKEREHLCEEFQAICFEMEAAALIEYRCLVVRGISDYSDSHKNKAWQVYAAATAAAYAQELVIQLPAPVHDVNIDRFQTMTINNQEPSTSQNCHWTVYTSRNLLFTGRDDIIRELETAIRNAVRNPSYTDQCRIVIYGMGGQGKSEICLQLAYLVRQIFWGVFWVDVSSTSSAKNDFLNIAKKLDVHAETMEEARQGLANAKQLCLLVLDNADDPDIDYQCYFPAGLLGVVIMTSRNHECNRYASGPAVELQGLSESDARGLLLHATDIPQQQWHTLQDDAQEVNILLQSHPLALIQAGTYISRAHCTIADYPRVFKRQRKRLLEFRSKQAQPRYQNVYATFEVSASLLQVSQTEAAKDALQLLSMLGIFAASRLPLQSLFEGAWKGAKIVSSYNSNDDDDFFRLTPWHVSHLPPLLQTDAGAWDPFRLIEAVGLLKAFSLVSTDPLDKFLNVSMHPLINAWALDRLDAAAQHNAWLATGCLVGFSSLDHMLWEMLGRQLEPHLGLLSSFEINNMFASEPPTEMASTIVRCGWLLSYLRNDTKLRDLIDKLLLYLNLDPLLVDEKWQWVYYLYARNLRNCGKTKEAVALLEQIVLIREQTLAEIHPDRLSSQHELAITYLDNGQIKRALSLLEQVILIREQTLAENHLDRLASQHVLARAYMKNGQIEKALSLLEQVVQIEEQILAESHPDRLASQHELARAYQANGQIEKAVSVLEQVVQVEEQTLAENHADRLTSLDVLANAYWANGQEEKAVSLLEHVVQIREEILAEDHPERQSSLHGLALAYSKSGKLDKGLSLSKEVVQIGEKTLAQDHPNLLASQHNLAVSLWRLNHRDAALQMMRHVVEVRRKVLDERHPSRINSEEWLKDFEDEMIETKAAESCGGSEHSDSSASHEGGV
ncbi:MAG: hypothetical protein Q9192_004210 [Flavoplaca navasiana]